MLRATENGDFDINPLYLIYRSNFIVDRACLRNTNPHLPPAPFLYRVGYYLYIELGTIWCRHSLRPKWATVVIQKSRVHVVLLSSLKMTDIQQLLCFRVFEN